MNVESTHLSWAHRGQVGLEHALGDAVCSKWLQTNAAARNRSRRSAARDEDVRGRARFSAWLSEDARTSRRGAMRVARTTPRYADSSEWHANRRQKSDSDLRSLTRAGDGNRTRVLSLGSPSVVSVRSAVSHESPAGARSALIRCYSLLPPICSHVWHEMTQISEVARSGTKTVTIFSQDG